MGTLQGLDEGPVVRLRARHLVGRGPANHLVCAADEVSSEHAVLSWDGDGWLLTDLGSRNGTRLNDRAVPPREPRPLVVGDRVVFGGALPGWRVVDVEPPRAAAVSEEEELLAEAGVLELPAGSGVATVRPSVEGGWELRTPEGSHPVVDGQLVEVDGRRWALELPQVVAVTRESERSVMHLETIALRFLVSLHEEHVTVEVLDRAGQLRHRASNRHHYTLLVLARLRLEDQERGLPPEEQGWVHRDDYLELLGASDNQLYNHTNRLRKELRQLGVVDHRDIVQRRADAGELRIGVPTIEVVTAR